MRKILEQCPSCGGALVVSGLRCRQCETAVTGQFAPCNFCRLSPEQSTFLELFVLRRGNLSEMEKALGISYPTVRNKLEEIIRLLQQPAPAVLPAASKRDEVLRRVAAGEVTAEEALTQLRGLETLEK